MPVKIENKLRLKRSESPSMTPQQTTFAIMAKFASSVQRQLGVDACLDDFIRYFGLRSAILLRALSGDPRQLKIAASGPAAIASGLSQKINDLVEDPTLAAGTTVLLEARSVLVILRADAGSVDLLQLNFEADPAPQKLADLHAMAPAMGLAWADRPPGSISSLIAAHHSARRSNVVELGSVAILDAENAFGLSRSEFRVCQLLGDGLRPAEIAEELGLSIATIRSHLRSIYAKTELSGQFEVLHHLKTTQASVA